jgi:signal transduction histidine kinase
VESGVDLERQVFRSQRQFLADASHEMRTPLTRLKLSLDQQPANVGAAQHATKSLGRLVDDLTLLANSDAGRLPMRQESIDARVVVSDALQLFDDSRIEAEFADHAVTVQADADQLMRLARNLLENALRYARTKVTVRVKETGLEIEDDGPGISPGDQERVFDRFVRLDESRTGHEGGAGLGLSIVKAIADAHGFEISLKSQPGKGTTFFLTW